MPPHMVVFRDAKPGFLRKLWFASPSLLVRILFAPAFEADVPPACGVWHMRFEQKPCESCAGDGAGNVVGREYFKASAVDFMGKERPKSPLLNPKIPAAGQ